MQDQFRRNINYMRVSITDRCNLRCRYCMPEEGIRKVPMAKILTFEEIIRICSAATKLGICDFRITGGEPLVRRGCPDLVRSIKDLPGTRKVMLTTNGQLLGQYIEELKKAGLDGVNVSLDSLKKDRYSFITRGGDLELVLESIDRARDAGMDLKINCLLQNDLNEDEAEDFAGLAFDKGIDVRFIEMMPIGFGAADKGKSNDDILADFKKKWPQLHLDEMSHGSGPAIYYHLPGRQGSIGFISAIHNKFCSDCNRVRLTSQGQLKPCLCYSDTVDLKEALDNGSDEILMDVIAEAINMKPQGHCFEKGDSEEMKSMSQIGG